MACVERVLIIGAGIAGLALTRKLCSLGVGIQIVERRLQTEVHGAGILLTGNAVRVLQTLGLDGTLLKRGRRVRSIRFTDEQERLLFELDCEHQHGWPPFVSIQRGALQETLLQAASPASPRWGTTLASLTEREDGVEAVLSDGTRSRYDLAVGADGVHSQMRTLLFGERRLDPLPGLCGWRFLAPCPARLVDPQYMLGNGRTLLLHPLPGGEVYCGAGPVVEAGLEGTSDLERMRAAFAGFGGFARSVLAGAQASQLIPTRYWHLEQRPSYRGACVLIGDAAHACAPTLAQGGAMALEDALVLGELLGQCTGLAPALSEFEARRRPRVSHAQAQSLKRMAANRHLDKREVHLRNAILSTIGARQFLDAWAPLMERLP